MRGFLAAHASRSRLIEHFRYSSRSVRAGAILAIRNVGKIVAARETTPNTTTTVEIVSQS